MGFPIYTIFKVLQYFSVIKIILIINETLNRKKYLKRMHIPDIANGTVREGDLLNGLLMKKVCCNLDQAPTKLFQLIATIVLYALIQMRYLLEIVLVKKTTYP